MIDWLFHTLFGPRTVKTDFKALANIWDIPKAEWEIKQTLKLASKYGPIDHIETIFATWWYDGGIHASCHSRRGDKVKCAFILNAKSEEYFLKWTGAGRFARLMWLLQAISSRLKHGDAQRQVHRPVSAFILTSPEVTIGVFGRAHGSEDAGSASVIRQSD